MDSRTHLVFSLITTLSLVGCGDSSGGSAGGAGGGGGSGGSGSSDVGGAGVGGMMSCAADDAGPNEDLGPGDDPEGGQFTLDEALEGLPEGPGPLRAIITTPLGSVTCELFDQDVPGGVANFVGLARGRRPWKDPSTDHWVKRRYYDGLIFHRVIPDFVIQGGDPLGTGTGGPGYSILDEVTGKTHSPGTLSYAKSSAPNSQGSQFFITEVATRHLDPDFTIFGGNCEPLSVVTDIANTPTNGEKPVTDVTMQIEITRCAPQ